jgi:hypothetical protein
MQVMQDWMSAKTVGLQTHVESRAGLGEHTVRIRRTTSPRLTWTVSMTVVHIEHSDCLDARDRNCKREAAKAVISRVRKIKIQEIKVFTLRNRQSQQEEYCVENHGCTSGDVRIVLMTSLFI